LQIYLTINKRGKMTIQLLKHQIEKIKNELQKEFTSYNRIFLNNRLITLKEMLKIKENYILTMHK